MSTPWNGVKRRPLVKQHGPFDAVGCGYVRRLKYYVLLIKKRFISRRAGGSKRALLRQNGDARDERGIEPAELAGAERDDARVESLGQTFTAKV